jgi:hypothetical protein
MARGGFLHDLWVFLKTEKKWWIVPLIVIALLLVLAIVLGRGSLGPFNYPIF